MHKFTFEKTTRRISSEEKRKLREEAIKAELLAEYEKKLKERLEEVDDDEDIEIEEDSSEKESKEIFQTLSSKTKNVYNKTLLKFLGERCSSILEVIDLDFENLVKKELFKLDMQYYLIYGAVQSGKTQFLQGVALAHIFWSRCPVIVILRNCRGDAQQLSNRCSSFMKQQKAYFSECGITAVESVKYFYVGGDKSEQSLRAAITGCNMIVCIANKTQLNRLARVLSAETRYATVIDEADSVAYGEEEVEFRKTLHESVLQYSGRTYVLTATTFNIIFTERKIPSTNIINLPIRPEYRGLEKIQMKVIDPKNETELEDYLKLLSTRNAYEHTVDDSLHKGLKKTDHPVILLIKKFHKKIKQQELARQVVEIGNWSEVIVFNGDGLTLYSKYIEKLSEIVCRGVQGETFSIKKKSFHIEQVRGDSGVRACIVVKAQIDEGLQYYRELHMSSKSTRISHLAVVSESMADRGISFVSKDYKWHLTTQYYEPSKKVTADSIIQSIRLCGNYQDDLPSILYSTEKVCDDLSKSFLIQKEMLMRLKCSEKVRSIPKILKKIPLNSEKVPKKRKFGIKEAELNIVEGDDGGVPISEYDSMLEKIGGMEIKSENVQLDSSDKLRRINPNSIGKSTILRKLYDLASSYILDTFGTGKWVPRTKIVKMLLSSGESYVKDENQIYGHFTSLYQKKYSVGDVSEDTNGFLMKKDKDLLWIRIN
jgi:hypothetical protein